MEFLKVLVVLTFAIHGSLSKPIGSDDELRVIVGQLERLVASLRQHADYVDKPEYLMSEIKPWSGSWSISEFPIPAARTLKNLLSPYFGSFPDGPYTSEMPVTQHDIVAKLSAWYKSDQVVVRQWAFVNIAGELLHAHFQCATTKLNQMVFYILKHKSLEMTENDQNMKIRVRNFLERSIMDTATVDKVAQEIVMTTQKHIYEEIIEHIGYFQLEDIEEILGKIKMFLLRAEQNKWSPDVFDEKLNQLLTGNVFVFKCPSMNDFWRFHQEIASRFQGRFPVIKPVTKTEAWLRKVLPTYMATDATPAINAILQACTDYVKSAMLHFKEIEDHVTTRNPADITNFMSRYLSPHQLKYLQSIFQFLNAEDTNNVIKMEEIGNSQETNRCTEFNGKCE